MSSTGFIALVSFSSPQKKTSDSYLQRTASIQASRPWQHSKAFHYLLWVAWTLQR